MVLPILQLENTAPPADKGTDSLLLFLQMKSELCNTIGENKGPATTEDGLSYTTTVTKGADTESYRILLLLRAESTTTIAIESVATAAGRVLLLGPWPASSIVLCAQNQYWWDR